MIFPGTLSCHDTTRLGVSVLVCTKRITGARERPPGRQDVPETRDETVIRRFVIETAWCGASNRLEDSDNFIVSHAYTDSAKNV